MAANDTANALPPARRQQGVAALTPLDTFSFGLVLLGGEASNASSSGNLSADFASEGAEDMKTLPRDETVTADLLSNPFIEQLAEAALGPNCFLGFFNGNTCLPNSGTQGLHSDAQWTWQTEEDARGRVCMTRRT